MRIYAVIWSILIALSANAQGYYMHRDTVILPTYSDFLMGFDKDFNGLTIQSESEIDWSGIQVVVGNSLGGFDTLYPQQDEHVERVQCNLLLFENQRYFSILTTTKVELVLIFQYVEPLDNSLPKPFIKRSLCNEPSTIIKQSEWRQGLDAPIPGRVSTPTKHCIVHHSAGGNGQSDFTQLVRSYYVQHTQVNGWDDIGYNYLIAADGRIYAGRDPEKQEISQDQVLGAHFCAKNTGTMGVCLIGDYTSVTPSNAMMSALEHLLTWKMVKDTLSPLGKFNHPNPQGDLLDAIAGHRQGCATECPGTQVYNRLATLRNVVYGHYVSCLPFVNTKSIWVQTQRYLLSNPSSGALKINQEYADDIAEITLVDSNGRTIDAKEHNKLNSGFYMVIFHLKNGTIVCEKLVVSG
jgi:hypothetical protein